MKDAKIKYLVRLSLLIAIELILAYTPLGYFKTAGLEITFLMIPVVVAGITMGPLAGSIVGSVFGLTSFATCFGTSVFGAMMLSINPIYTFIVCVPTRILAGYFAGLIYKVLKSKNTNIPLLVTSLLGPISNTIFFMLALVICFYNSQPIQDIATALNTTNPFAFVIAFVGLQGLIEAVVVFIVSYLISKPLLKVMK